MSNAPDTPAQRRAEYRRLFSGFLADRERSEAGITFRFLAAPGMRAWVRDLAAREEVCCPFFTIAVTATDQEVRWDISVIDDDLGRQALEEFYRLPETLAGRDHADGSRAAGDRPGPA